MNYSLKDDVPVCPNSSCQYYEECSQDNFDVCQLQIDLEEAEEKEDY